MYLKFEHSINDDVFQTKITVDSYGTDHMSAEMEKELLSRHPIIINTKDLIFTGWIRKSEEMPVVSKDFGLDAAVTVPDVPHGEWVLGDSFEAMYSISLKDIPATDLNAIVTSREFAAMAYCMIYDTTIKKAVAFVMKVLRAKYRPFEHIEVELV